MMTSVLVRKSHRASEDCPSVRMAGMGEGFSSLEMNQQSRKERKQLALKRFYILLRGLSLYHKAVTLLWIRRRVSRFRGWLR